jgi:predicted lipid-binding transport protein (Tim44 family)
MHLDILVFAIIAAFLVYRLKSVLGTRHGDELPRQNPFVTIDVTPTPPKPKPLPLPKPPLLIDDVSNKDGRIDTGLDEIAAADHAFDLVHFMEGAKYAFETIVIAYAKGDRAALKPLLSPKLYADFDAGITVREAAGRTMETTLHHIKAARVVAAHLGGAMAYITVDYDVEQTTVTRDKEGVVVEGDPNNISCVRDIWTFTRDTRAHDPNWTLIETAAAEKE